MARTQYFIGFFLGAFFVLSVLLLKEVPSSPTGFVVGEPDTSLYPEPFRQDGYFQGVIVVGENAAAGDTLAAMQLAKSLQYVEVEVQQPTTSQDSELEVEGETFLIESASDFLEGSETLGDVIEAVTSDDFSLLADGSIDLSTGEYPFKQLLYLSQTITTVFEAASDVPNDPEEIPLLYLEVAKDGQAYRYVLEFEEALELISGSSTESYAFTKLEGERLTMLGETFIVVEAKHPAADSITLSLMGGNLVERLTEGATAEYVVDGNTYTVEATFIDAKQEEVLFTVNGETLKSIGTGKTANVDDVVSLGILDVLVNEKGGFVEFLLDSKRYELSDGDITSTTTVNPYKVNGETITNTNVQFTGTDAGLVEGSEMEITDLEVTWTPSRSYYLLTGDKLSNLLQEDEALFTGNWDIIFNGFTTKDASETISLEPKGNDEYVLYFENLIGEELKMPLFYDDGTTDFFERFGTDDDALVVDEGTQIAIDDYFLVTSDGAAGRFSSVGSTHLLRYQDIDIANGYLTLSDLGRKKDFDVPFTSASTSFSLGGTTYDVEINDTNNSVSNITVDMNNDESIDSGDVPILVTKSGTIELDASTFETLVYTSRALDEGIALSVWSPYGTTESVDSFNITVTDDDGIDISSVQRCLGANYEEMAGVIGAAGAAGVMASCFSTFSNTPYALFEDVGDEDRKQSFLTYGHLLELVEEDRGPDVISIAAPEEQLRFLVYLADIRTSLTKKAVEGSVQKVEQFLPESVTMDAASSEMYQIIVGGPCVNDVAARLLPNSDCSYGFTPNRALIKRVTLDGKEYLLVAGYGQSETAAAIEVLESYDSYQLFSAGTEVVLTSEGIETRALDWGSYVQGEVAKVVEVQEPTVVEESCELPTSVEGEYRTESKKLAIKVESLIETKAESENLKAGITIKIDKPFKARFGIDWLDQNVHILKDHCRGEEVALLNFHWLDGSQEQTKYAELPEPGCYCMRFTDADMELDSAKINIVPTGEHHLEFGAD